MAINLVTLEAQLQAVDGVLNRLLRLKFALKQYAHVPSDAFPLPEDTAIVTDEELALLNEHADVDELGVPLPPYDVRINADIDRIAEWTAIVLADSPLGSVDARDASIDALLTDIRQAT